MALLDVKDLSVSFVTRDGTKKAVDSVCFNVEEKEITAIIGEAARENQFLVTAYLASYRALLEGLMGVPLFFPGGTCYPSPKRREDLSVVRTSQ
mgnify:CR=1 FL=1